MYEPKVLGLVPARSGSKGIKNKNTIEFNGFPLIYWCARSLVHAKKIGYRMCSTNDLYIADLAKKSGLEVPFLRPSHLARDETLIVDVIKDTLLQLSSKNNLSFSHVALIQPTSPTVLPEDIDGAIRLSVREDADTVITGCRVGQKHPAAMYTVSETGQVTWLINDENRMTRRQDLHSVFVRTGLVYVIKASLVLEQEKIYGPKVCSYEIPEERAVTIDSYYDLKLAKYMMDEN